MAGPGGGPPRKSHTKSRKGCKTCKRRHIRCDETFPQCRNCTKHSCRCDYMDQPSTAEETTQSPRMPDLQMTPEIERELEEWRATGEPPFPELRLEPRGYWHRFSITDLRLIHHISGLSIEMQQRGLSGCTVWAQKMLSFLAIALSSDYVLSAILALSASHLAWNTKNQHTEQLAYQHRGVALKGLHQAIGQFSRENSEAVLAASMLLSWQATEWRSWSSLQHGTSTILDEMKPWAHESKIADYVESQRATAGVHTPGTPSLPPIQPGREELARLDQATAALRELRSRLASSFELSNNISALLGFLQDLRRDFPVQAPGDAFERLQELRLWLFWLPARLLQSDESDLGALAVLAHFFGVALALDPLFPEIGGSYLGSMSVSPIEEIHRILLAKSAAHPLDAGVMTALSLIDVPCRIMSSHKAKHDFLIPRPQSYQASPHSPYSTPNAQSVASSGSVPLSVYTQSPVLSPANAASQGSPYVSSSIPSSGLSRTSGYFDNMPRVPSQASGDYPYTYSGTPLGSTSGYQSPHVKLEGHRLSSGGYEPPIYQGYGIDTGFVSPTELWT